ncbi:MAG: DUF1801 domain-containing protein [Saprospiraceae bacterium]|nr:DUF1801 domain-containing protein [Saprospiraceae bacterium]
MDKAKNKTVETSNSVEEFLSSITDGQKQKDARKIVSMMQKISGAAPKMWGTNIVGFGDYHYRYESGREGDSMKVGFSPRAQNLTLYIVPGFDRYDNLMEKLGKFKTGKSCLYINKLEDVEWDILEELSKSAYEYMTDKYG